MMRAKETPDNEANDLSRYQTRSGILAILRSMQTVAVVGLSANELRASHFVGFYLKNHGYRIVPVNPREKSILGETSYASLKDIPFAVDVVNVFRAPAAVPGIATEAVEIGAKCLWLQFGVKTQHRITIESYPVSSCRIHAGSTDTTLPIDQGAVAVEGENHGNDGRRAKGKESR